MSETDAKRTLTAIVFADVVGYSLMMSQDDAGTVALMRQRRSSVIDPLMTSFGGRLVNAAGDSLLIQFGSVVDAAQFAIAMQQSNAALNASSDTGRTIEFRLGVSLGDVLMRHGAVFGDSVNIAARLQSLADPGGICFSATCREQVRGRVDVELVDRGAHTVKNIPYPVEVYALSPDAIAAAPRRAVRPHGRRWRHAAIVAACMVLVVVVVGGVVMWRRAVARADFADALDRDLAASQARLGTEARRKLVADYLAQHPHRAFAIAPRAQSHWWTGDWPSGDMAREKALERCELSFGEPCVLASVDDTFLGTPATPAPMPRVNYDGTFDPAEIPGIREILTQRKDVAGYAAATGPKAIAIHPRGVLTVVTDADTQHRAELQALKDCNDDPSSRSSDEPCFLYASGDTVVLRRRSTIAMTPKS